MSKWDDQGMGMRDRSTGESTFEKGHRARIMKKEACLNSLDDDQDAYERSSKPGSGRKGDENFLINGAIPQTSSRHGLGMLPSIGL